MNFHNVNTLIVPTPRFKITHYQYAGRPHIITVKGNHQPEF